MKAYEKYFVNMAKVVEECERVNKDSIMEAAKIMAETTEKGGLIYAYGVGHSHLIIDDCNWRASTPANYYALLEDSASGNNNITKSYLIENTYGVGTAMINYARINPLKDCLIIVSNSGNNIAPVDAAIRAKELGIKVIAITAVKYGDFLPTKHKSGKKLKDLADVVLDNCCLIGDAVVDIDGFDVPTGSCSTIPMVYLQNAALTQMVELLVQKGITPDVYYNGHMALVDGNKGNHNDELVTKYFNRIRNL